MAFSRRTALRTSLIGGAGVAVAAAVPACASEGSSAAPAAASSASPSAAPAPEDAAAAMRLLEEGNARWRDNNSVHPRQGADRRAELLEGQSPFVTVLSCADSRVPPELIFDQGLGDVFTIRSAGQVLDESVLGSLSYAGLHIDSTRLIVVLGHQSCGAVTAAVEAHESGEVPEGHVGYLVEEILPVVEATPEEGDDFLDDCVRANAVDIAGRLQEDEDLRGLVEAGTLEIVPARYDLETGAVTWL
ncbi:carbonic anhydrase [Nocardiopsis sp. NRRL B-16309]|uniref:carbonic anhydrase n=1 Tax=Nocardiopsis sp. NRRL B-16309 TaxID=1519494 RepID=UPI0006AF2439|nr:carbonic anhydrase [Nocardiopsis sp. NRRL B-16309]KOX15982.1 carbonic anhydrase [Nocardiopsis sp. NRRL B-16309]